MARRTTKTTLRKKLDKAWSLVILSRGKCEVCGSQQSLNPHHIEGRRNLRLRWEPRNGVCLCSGCHVFRIQSAHQSPEWFHYWLEDKRWEDLSFVLANREEIKKWTIEDMQEQLDKLTSLLK